MVMLRPKQECCVEASGVSRTRKVMGKGPGGDEGIHYVRVRGET